jgi:hypothetical protein
MQRRSPVEVLHQTCSMIQQEFHDVDVAPHDMVVQRPVFLEKHPLIGISVVVQEKLHHISRPRSMNGTVGRMIAFVVLDQIGAVF